MTDYKQIYLQPECCADNERLWCEDPDPEDCEDGIPWTRYVRGDLFDKANEGFELYERKYYLEKQKIEGIIEVIAGIECVNFRTSETNYLLKIIDEINKIAVK